MQCLTARASNGCPYIIIVRISSEVTNALKKSSVPRRNLPSWDVAAVQVYSSTRAIAICSGVMGSSRNHLPVAR